MTTGHTESNANPGYTGDSPSARALYAGYSSRYIAENVSAGNLTVEDSIDGLFSAIYHRFGFLHLSYDLIGIGINQVFYTYNLGNDLHNQLCQNPSYTGTESYYLNTCSDSSKRISAIDYTHASNHLKALAPKIILWPPENAKGIPPVFYEESPDPLPTHSVSGYPISVEFNDANFTTAPAIIAFTLTDDTNTTLSSLITMTQNNDPSNKFSAYQTALFPENRLEWGSLYTASLSYDDNGTASTKTWCFSTKSLLNEATNFYRIDNNNDIYLDVLSNESYALYVVPSHTNDTIGSVSYSYLASNVSFSYIDNNTVKITLTGAVGNYAIFTFNNGQKITLTIQNSDTALPPKNESCPTPNYIMNLSANTTTITENPTPIDIILDIHKAHANIINEPLIIHLPKNQYMSLNFNTNLQTLQGMILSNDKWSFSQTPMQYKLTYIGTAGIFPNDTTMNIGIQSIFTPPMHARGSFIFKSYIPSDSNQTDIPYFDITYSKLAN